MKINQNIKIISAVIAILAISFGLLAYKHFHTNKIVAQASPNITDTCSQLDPRYQNAYSCYKTELNKIVSSTGPEQATKLIQTQYGKVPYVKSFCHQLMHVVGRAAYAKYNNLAQTFAHGSQYCNGGYYHGLSEMLGTEKGLAYLKQNANTLCTPIAQKTGRYSFYHYNCVHGLGHAFMEVTDGELYQSLQGCDLIKDTWERSSCYGGVFMQNIMIEQSPDDSSDHTSKYLKPDDPLYPCTAVDGKYKTQCYLMQTSHALTVENNSFLAVFNLCAGVEDAYRQTCYTSMGRDASGQSVYDPVKTANICLSGTTQEGKTYCINGAVQDYIDNFQSDKQANQICQQLSPDMQDGCYSLAKKYVAKI